MKEKGKKCWLAALAATATTVLTMIGIIIYNDWNVIISILI